MPNDVGMRFYTVEQVGENRFITPEKFLLCTDVTIARTGVQTYGPGETPIDPGPDGLVYVTRTEEEVFRKETIDSANGKSLCNDHPDDDVKPDTWRELTVGVILNPRRGTGSRDQELLADILVTDLVAIGLVQDGKVELSCGYDANYEQDDPGKGRQTDIIINHVALVDRGRCGQKCSIRDRMAVRDSATRNCGRSGGKAMAKSVATRFKDGFRSRWGKVQDAIKKAMDETDPNKKEEEMEKALDRMKDAAEEEREEGEAEGEGRTKWHDEALDNRFDEIDANQKAHDAHMKTCDSRLDELEGGEAESAADAKRMEDAMEEEAPEGTGDKARKAKDSAFLDDSFQNTVSIAEIMAPGLHHPTFDTKADPKKTYDAICGLRRKALQVAAATTDGAAIITEVRGGKVLTVDGLRTMDCADVRTVFLGAGASYRTRATTTSRAAMATVDAGAKPAVKSENERNAEFWKGV